MIRRRDDLQAYECTGCGVLYELPRGRGVERDLNDAIEYRQLLEANHSKCLTRAADRRKRLERRERPGLYEGVKAFQQVR